MILRKKDLNPALYLALGNAKLVGAENIQFLTWSITAIKTCRFATDFCKFICYAALDENRRPNIKNSHDRHLKESKKPGFICDMVDKLTWELNRPKNAGKIIFVRIHQAGDFFSLQYLQAWAAIAAAFKGNKRIYFQAYTKALPLLKLIDLQATNIRFIFSIMKDTPQKQIEEARAMGLTTFEAVPVNAIKSINNKIVCPGECGKCLHCYKGNKQKEIIIAYHGARKKAI